MAEQTEISDPADQEGGHDSIQPRMQSTLATSMARPSLRRRQSTILRDARDKLMSLVSSASKISADRDGFKGGTYLNGVLNPYSKFVQRWNKIFFLSMLIAFGIDPLFFYTLVVDSTNICTYIDFPLALVLTIVRSMCDLVYAIHIGLQFRIAFVSTETRNVGRGELIISKRLIARNYLRGPFTGDLIAVLPMPQLAVWCIIPYFLKTGDTADMAKDLVLIIALVQYVPRVIWIFYHYRRMKRATGIVFETAWSGFALNVLVYVLLSHILGACWYLFALQRVDHCVREACTANTPLCSTHYLHCDNIKGLDTDLQRADWLSSDASNISSTCFAPLSSASFNYGIYSNAVDLVTVRRVSQKVLYSFFWGLQALSTTADNLTPSKFEGEVTFVVLIIFAGLLLFSLLVGNMQTFLQSLGRRMEEYRTTRRDMEEWMLHRRLPEDLRKQVTDYQRHHWAATRGVDEDQMLQSLPADLRSGIKFHMCMNLICNVPIFLDLDIRVKQALCDVLHQQLFIQGSCVMREGDPVPHMLFIIRGELVRFRSVEGKEGGKVGLKGKGGFCGAELLLFLLRQGEEALDDLQSGRRYPVAQSTIRCTKAVDAFSLSADDLEMVIRRFKLREDGKLQAAVNRQQRADWEASAKAEALEQEENDTLSNPMDAGAPAQTDAVAVEIERPSGRSTFQM